ncbi:MAG: molybdopterin molybdenumtransferase MoeA [Frankiales bacterium]|nr:molybdopterin molybdenumtransferase MoeA [Frankiales bacterium]
MSAAPAVTAGRAVSPAWDVARDLAYRSGRPLPLETVPLGAADGRTLGVDVVAGTPLPAFTASAMDGWATSGDGPWLVVGRVLAGQSGPPVRPGTALAIATGARLPAGATGVVRSEDGTVVDGVLTSGDDPAGRHIRPAGEEALEGEALLHAGTVLGPGHVGLAAAAGADALTVVRRPTCTLLVLGDELLDAGPAREGRVRDSLGPQLPGWLRRLGVDVRRVTHVRDDRQALVDSFLGACTDLVITTGGTAAGPVDHVHAALDRTGAQLVVDSVAVRPGHPMLLAALPGHRHLVGLPGNPQAAIAALLTLAEPVIARLLNRPAPRLGTITSEAAFLAPPHATRMVLAHRGPHGAVAARHLGPGMLRGLATAEGFVIVPPGGSQPGAVLPWLPLPV